MISESDSANIYANAISEWSISIGVCQYSVFIYKTSVFVSEWCGTLVVLYRIALLSGYILNHMGLQLFMATFWILSAAAHWFFVWALVVQVSISSHNPYPLVYNNSAEEYQALLSITSSLIPNPTPTQTPDVRECVPAHSMEAAFQVIEEFVEPSVCYVVPIFLLICSALVILFWPEIKWASVYRPHRTATNENAGILTRGGEGTKLVNSTWTKCRRDSLFLLLSLLCTSLLFKSPFVVYRFWCQLVRFCQLLFLYL